MRATVGRGPLLLVVCLVSACSGGSSANGDAGNDAGSGQDGGSDGGRDGGRADAGADAGSCAPCTSSTDERCWDGVCTKFVRVNLDYRRSYYSGMSCLAPACNVTHEADGGQAAQLQALFSDAGCAIDVVAGSAGVPPTLNIGCTDNCAPNALMCCTWFPPDAGHETCGWVP